MNHRERVLAALQGNPVDHPPVGFWFHFPGEQGKGQACIDAHLGFYNNIPTDLVKIMCDGYFEYPITGVESAADFAGITPLPEDHPYFTEQLARARGVREGLAEPHFVLYNVNAPFSCIRNGTSDAFVMEALKSHPAETLSALDAIAETQARLCERLLAEAGVDGVYYCVQGGEKERFTPEEYRRLITPSDLLPLRRANAAGGRNILHCCGWAGLPNHVQVWQDYPAAAVNWACFIENLPVPEGKAFFGGRCVLGGMDNRRDSLLVNGSESAIKAEVRRLVSETPSGLIVGADCTLPATIDRSHIRWVIEAVSSL